ncbi:MAG: hypothetical protein U1A27_03620 [Phycisphaerae bacterium]
MLQLLVLVSLAFPSQSPPPDGPPGPGFRGGPPDPARMREMRDAYMKASPEERRKMRLDRYVGMVNFTYELTDEQRVRVRGEMEKMQREYYERLGPRAAELEKLENRMSEFWLKQGAQGDFRERRPWESAEFREMRDKMRAIQEAVPFDRDAAMKRIETLLPPDQVATGQRRREEFRQRMEQWRQRNGPDGRGGPFGARGSSDGNNAERGDRDTPAAQVAPVAPAQHPWERYFREFASKHDLGPMQRTAGDAIVKEMIARERNYRQARSTQFAEAAKIPSESQRTARLKELEGPVDELFSELKTRLDDLLTAEQRGLP